jgi:4-amino-4-deoxy-L-arabinose transferase-like glycosyltransferase
VFVLIGIGFGLRSWWALEITPQQHSDARTYSNLARALAAGEGYQHDGRPSAYYPIGYSVALAVVYRLFGAEANVARIANAVFAIGTLFGLYALSRALTNSRCAASLTLLSFVLYPADVGFTSVTLSQAFFNTLALLGCALCLSRRWPRWQRLAAGGVLLGCATLTRHQGAALVLVVGAALVLQRHGRRRWARAIIVTAAFIASLAPWTIRNALALSAFVPVATNGGINLYIGNNPHANGRYKITPAIDAPIARAVPGPRKGGHNEVLVDRFTTRLAWRYVSQQPRAALALWPVKFATLYDDDSAFAVWSRPLPNKQQRATLRTAKRIDAKYYQLLLGFGGVGVCVAVLELCSPRRRRNPRVWVPAVVVIAFTMLHLFTFGDASYHHPMLPWIAIYLGHGLSAPWRHRDLFMKAGRVLFAR